MRLTKLQLRALIKEETTRVMNEMAAVTTIKRLIKLGKQPLPRDKMTLEEAKLQIDEILENEVLLNIAEEVRKMSSSQAPPDKIVAYLESEFVGTTLEAIQMGIGLSTPAQLKELEFLADFGDVDMLSSEMQRRSIKDPLDALNKLKLAVKEKTRVTDAWLIAVQLRTLHDVLQGVSYELAKLLPGSGPIEPPLW